MLVHRHRHGHHLAVLRHRHRPFRGHRHVLHRSLTIAVRRRLVLLPILAHDGHRGAVHVGPVLRHRHSHRRRLHQLDHARIRMARGIHRQLHRTIRVPRRRCRHPRVGHPLHQIECGYTATIGRALLPAHRYRRSVNGHLGGYILLHHLYFYWVQRQVARAHLAVRTHRHRHIHRVAIRLHGHRPLRRHRHARQRHAPIPIRIDVLVRIPDAIHKGNRRPPIHPRRHHRLLRQLDHVRIRLARRVHLQGYRAIRVPRRRGLRLLVVHPLHQVERRHAVSLRRRRGLPPGRHRRAGNEHLGGCVLLHHLYRHLAQRQVARVRHPIRAHRHRNHQLPRCSILRGLHGHRPLLRRQRHVRQHHASISIYIGYLVRRPPNAIHEGYRRTVVHREGHTGKHLKSNFHSRIEI